MSQLVLAGDLVTEVQRTYQKNTQFHADFVQTTKIELLDKEVTERGELVFTKSGKFSIHYRGPQERKYISDGTTLWIYHGRGQEAERYSVKEVLSHEALAFLGGLGEMTKEFQVTAEKESWLVLVPRTQKSPFRKIRLKIDPATAWAVEVILFPRQGNESRYQFSNIQTKFQND